MHTPRSPSLQVSAEKYNKAGVAAGAPLVADEAQQSPPLQVSAEIASLRDAAVETRTVRTEVWPEAEGTHCVDAVVGGWAVVTGPSVRRHPETGQQRRSAIRDWRTAVGTVLWPLRVPDNGEPAATGSRRGRK